MLEMASDIGFSGCVGGVALIRDEPIEYKVVAHIAHTAFSAINLHEVIWELWMSKLEEVVICNTLSKLRVELFPHDIDTDTDAAYAAAT